MRFKVSHVPFIAPCLVIASIAYWLHVGINRQLDGNIGEMLS